MRKIFYSYFKQFGAIEKQRAEAQRLSNLSLDSKNWKEVANAIYGKTHPNGKHNTDKDDGWRYSGKGFKQITWRDNYRILSEHFNKKLKEKGDFDVDWLSNPDLLETNPRDSILSALVYWDWKKINNVVKGTTDIDVNNVTAKINKSKDESIRRPRRYFFKEAIKVFKLNECIKVRYKKLDYTSTFDGKYDAQGMDAYIDIITPKGRDLQGPLIVFDNTGVLFKIHSLCRGSNPNRLKAAGNGDTPTGRATTNYNPNAHKGEFSYGNYGLIYLEGIDSEFNIATQNGRAGIAIHSGHTSGYYKKSLEDMGKLMATYGCIRIYNNDMKELVKLYTQLKKQGKRIYCYIEDYNGDIKDVYKHYQFDVDIKDKSRGERSSKQ